jgi:hypothetical protein
VIHPHCDAACTFLGDWVVRPSLPRRSIASWPAPHELGFEFAVPADTLILWSSDTLDKYLKSEVG